MKKSYSVLNGLIDLLGVFMQHALFWGWVITTKLIFVLVGALFGWITGLFFGNTILGILADFDISGYSMWQIGAFLGFVGSFFGTTTNFNKDSSKNESVEQKKLRPQ